jgi:hypothetical protein
MTRVAVVALMVIAVRQGSILLPNQILWAAVGLWTVTDSVA